MPDPNPKDRDWIDVSLKASTPLIVGVVIAWVGFFGDEALNKISHRQESARLITELQIRREQAESALRKDIFAQALEAFLLKGGKSAGGAQKPSLDDMSKQLLRLELLALNFGDSLSLSPLFAEMRKDLAAARPLESEVTTDYTETRVKLLKRLTSLAKRVGSAQFSSLVQHGEERKIRIPLDAYLTEIEPLRGQCYSHEIVGKKSPTLLFRELDYSWPNDAGLARVRDTKIQEVSALLQQLVAGLAESRERLDQEQDGWKERLGFAGGDLDEEDLDDSLAQLTAKTARLVYVDERLNDLTIAKNKLEIHRQNEMVARMVADLWQQVEEITGIIAAVLEWQENDFGDEIDSTAWKALKDTYGKKGSGVTDHTEMFEKFVNESKRLKILDVERDIEVFVSAVDPCENSLRVGILVQRPEQEKPETTRNFRLDYFNFPVVDNTRLADNHRLAVVIEEFDIGEVPYIEIAMVIFPSEYASLRDRPGMEEARRLLEAAMQDKPVAPKVRRSPGPDIKPRGHAGKADRSDQ